MKQFRIVVTVLWLRVLDCLCHEGRCRDPAPPNGVEDCGAERLQATWCRDVNMLALWLAKPDPRFPGAKSPWQPEERWNSCTSRVGRRRRQHSEIAARERWSPSITFAKQETGADLAWRHAVQCSTSPRPDGLLEMCGGEIEGALLQTLTALDLRSHDSPRLFQVRASLQTE